jgi:hypothetical protein
MALTIEWQLSDGTSAIEIARATDYIGEWRLAIVPASQPIEKLRAEYAQHIGRGNVSHRLTFLVTHAEEATAEDAKAFIVAKSVELAAAVLTHSLLEGVFGALEWQLSDCAMEPVELWHVGVTVYARYSFIGGALADTTPA